MMDDMDDTYGQAPSMRVYLGPYSEEYTLRRIVEIKIPEGNPRIAKTPGFVIDVPELYGNEEVDYDMLGRCFFTKE